MDAAVPKMLSSFIPHILLPYPHLVADISHNETLAPESEICYASSDKLLLQQRLVYVQLVASAQSHFSFLTLPVASECPLSPQNRSWLAS